MDASQSPVLDKSVPCYKEGTFNEAEILEAFHEDGYVVVTGVFDEALVERSVDELWQSPQLLGRDPRILRNDPKSWTSDKWPQSDGGRNFLEPLDAYQVQASWELAANHNAVEVMQLLWREHQAVPGKQLFMPAAPRWGVMRPTADHPEWKTDSKWLHWDQNPWRDPGFKWVQAFAQLSNSTSESGGLLLVPGFHKHWERWGAENPMGSVFYDGVRITDNYGKGQPFPVPEDDPTHLEVKRVVAPAGSLVLWDSRLPHQNFPNTSADQFRVIMYLNYINQQDDPELGEDPLVAEIRDKTKKKIQVMRVQGVDVNASYWPSQLSKLGADVTGAPTSAEQREALDRLDAEPDLADAIRLTLEAGEAEVGGDLTLSMNLLRQAERKYREIGQWHVAIFG